MRQKLKNALTNVNGKKRKLFVSSMLFFRLFFGVPESASASSNSKNVQNGVGSKAEVC